MRLGKLYTEFQTMFEANSTISWFLYIAQKKLMLTINCIEETEQVHVLYAPMSTLRPSYHIISMCVCACVRVCVRYWRSPEVHRPPGKCYCFSDGDCRPQKGCPVRWQP